MSYGFSQKSFISNTLSMIIRGGKSQTLTINVFPWLETLAEYRCYWSVTLLVVTLVTAHLIHHSSERSAQIESGARQSISVNY